MQAGQDAPRRQRRPRGSISTEEILQGAFDVAREVSLDQLSMATLADRLGVGVTSIYWYFRKKEDLLQAMTEVAVENLVSQLPTFDPDAPWQTVLHDHFVKYRAIHMNDEIISDLLLIRVSNYSRRATTQIFRPIEGVISRLCDAGFRPETALSVFNAISTYTRGVIVYERILKLSSAAILDSRKKRIADWAGMPILQAMVADERSLTGTSDADFEFGISSLISGFERQLDAQ